MKFILYFGVILFCYGIYNILCYLLMLPTARAGRYSAAAGRKSHVIFLDVAAMEISNHLVKKFGLKWNRSKKVEHILREQGINVETTVFFIRKVILFLAETIILLPMLFMDEIIFGIILGFWIIFRIVDILKVIPNRKKEKIKRKIIGVCCKLLLEAFFLVQIMVFMGLFT